MHLNGDWEWMDKEMNTIALPCCMWLVASTTSSDDFEPVDFTDLFDPWLDNDGDAIKFGQINDSSNELCVYHRCCICGDHITQTRLIIIWKM